MRAGFGLLGVLRAVKSLTQVLGIRGLRHTSDEILQIPSLLQFHAKLRYPIYTWVEWELVVFVNPPVYPGFREHFPPPSPSLCTV